MKRHNPRFEAAVDRARARITELTVEQLRARTDPYTLIDVREDREWAVDHIVGAIHLSKGILERDIGREFDTDAPLVLYCGGGYRSALAAEALQQMGYTQVASMDGGIRRWRNLGLPLTTEG
jgi:rhodanese-related sulfurtransferase